MQGARRAGARGWQSRRTFASKGYRLAAPLPPLPCTLRRHEAQGDAAQEPLLSSFLYASILSHDNFERSLAFVLSNRLSDATFLSTELFEGGWAG